MTETCADCGQPIHQNDPSYYQMDPACCIGKSYHSVCGPMRPTPQGILQAEIARLQDSVTRADACAENLAIISRDQASEIARLRAALGDTSYPLGEIDGLMAENARLRAALATLWEWNEGIQDGKGNHHPEDHLSIIRAALNHEQEAEECPHCKDYVGKCPKCGRPRPRP